MNEKQPSVSIVIASYNSAEYLPATIGSCLAQTYPITDVIVIDDGSTDDTPAVCAQFEDAIQYVRVPNGGVSAARNRGAELASGEWLLFLDSDDILLLSGVASLMSEAATSPECGVIYGMVIQRAEVADQARLNGFDYCAGPPPLPAQRNFRRSAIITPGSAIVKKSLHAEVGGFVTGYEPMEDRDFWVKCGLLQAIGYCDTVVLDKTWRESSAGSNAAKRIYRGLFAQQYLRPWCHQHGVTFCWPDTDAQLTEAALREAIYYRTDEILDALLDKSHADGYRGVWYVYGRLLRKYLAWTRRLPPTPRWVATRPILP